MLHQFGEIVGSMAKDDHRLPATLWRVTVEYWLRRQGLIAVRLIRLVSLILLMAYVSACRSTTCEYRTERHAHSADFTEQVLMLSDKVALIKFIGRDDGELNFSLVQTHWQGEPEFAASSGYQVDKWLATGIQKVSAALSEAVLLVDMGESPSHPRYAFIELKTGRTSTSNSLNAINGTKIKLSTTWTPANLYFDIILHDRSPWQ